MRIKKSSRHPANGRLFRLKQNPLNSRFISFGAFWCTKMKFLCTKKHSSFNCIVYDTAIDSETRFVLGFHLSPHRDSLQAFRLYNSVKQFGKPNAIVSDCYSAYKVPVKSIFGVKHVGVESFKDIF